MRRVVRNLFENPKSNNYGDLSTIFEKKVLKEIKEKIIHNE